MANLNELRAFYRREYEIERRRQEKIAILGVVLVVVAVFALAFFL